MTTLHRRHALQIGLGAAATVAAPHYARAQSVEITIHYAAPWVFKDSKDATAAEFAKREPNIKINWITTADYEEGTQLLLRQVVTNQLPDLSYQGFNRLRVFAERGIAVDLTPLLRAEGDLAAMGYSDTILALGRFGGIQAGLAYAASNPIVYVNADLVRRAGADPDRFPTRWDDVLELGRRIKALGDGIDSFFYTWNNADWMFSALLFGHGGRMMTEDERDVAFAGPEGLSTLRLLDRMVKEGQMPNMALQASSQAFSAGKLGFSFRSTAALRNAISAVGRNFELRTTMMPVIDPVRGRLPTGGAAGMITARDPAKRDAAFKFLRFSTSAEGTAIMVKNTGYVPCNQLAIDDPRYLGEFYRENPLFVAATRQVPISVPWYAFPGANSVRITQTIVDNLARVVEQRATPEAVLADMAREVRRLLPRQG